MAVGVRQCARPPHSPNPAFLHRPIKLERLPYSSFSALIFPLKTSNWP